MVGPLLTIGERYRKVNVRPPFVYVYMLIVFSGGLLLLCKVIILSGGPPFVLQVDPFEWLGLFLQYTLNISSSVPSFTQCVVGSIFILDCSFSVVSTLLLVQPNPIHCVFLAYFEPKKYTCK